MPREHVSQPFGQCHEALAAQHDVGMLKAAIGQPEVIEPMDQWLACNGDAQIGHVGEIGQTHATGLVNLAENDLPPNPKLAAPCRARQWLIPTAL